MNIGARHISLSTCGITENIDKLAECDLQLSLAVSLHAPDDETRSRLMPVNKSTGVDNLLKVCGRYASATGRRITYEYALIDGVNDTPRHAEMLVRKLKNTRSHLNLIFLNNVAERAFKVSSRDNVKLFTSILERNKVNFTFRRNLGGDIDASCGQLRGKYVNGIMGNN
jgi:23S rRNA (adenine2503-C2)-methyltransferase